MTTPLSGESHTLAPFVYNPAQHPYLLPAEIHEALKASLPALRRHYQARLEEMPTFSPHRKELQEALRRLSYNPDADNDQRELPLNHPSAAMALLQLRFAAARLKRQEHRNQQAIAKLSPRSPKRKYLVGVNSRLRPDLGQALTLCQHFNFLRREQRRTALSHSVVIPLIESKPTNASLPEQKLALG